MIETLHKFMWMGNLLKTHLTTITQSNNNWLQRLITKGDYTKHDRKVFSAGDSFATTSGETANYCESISTEPAVVFVAYAGLNESKWLFP